MTEVAAHAAPSLPTPLSLPEPVDPDVTPTSGEALVWWRRSTTPDDAAARATAPSGWRPTAGSRGGLPPVDGAARWLIGAGDGTTPQQWRAVGAAVATAAGRPTDAAATAEHAGDDADPGAVVDPVDTSPAAVEPASPPRAVLVRPETAADAPDDADGWAALATGIVLGSHRFLVRARRTTPPAVRLAVPAEHRPAVARALVLARATAVARDLADTPSGTKSPDWFARTAQELVDGVGLEVAVRDEQWLAEQGFGGVLAVGGGSVRPPRFLELSWTPRDGAGGPAEHVVLIGKGITFDTGGISIKPTASMVDMRTDCAGGAAVVGALRAIAELDAPRRVTGLVPLAENHVSGSAYRPGDVVRHRDGTTSEVTNTDAEGRMVLADALGHAVERLGPDLLVDVATLTGAMKSALGVRTGGVFASDPALAARTVAAGERTGEAWWPMPLSTHLDADVDSAIADIRQAPPGPGAIMAALFLHRFTAGRPWVHLDIAGPARCDKPHEEVAKGATGFAARTLVELCAPEV